ncbi:MAG: hypothetical protein RLZZ546_2064, partial [Bacteroidota bacterium]
LMQIIYNHKKFIDENTTYTYLPENRLENFCLKILKQKALIKSPILFILCIPIFFLFTSILLIFGQKPDSMIRAFTDTYKHGFSQLDYLCENVTCGGHFLCSVAANGHKNIVKPIRYGERNGHKIICNRQLLIANAFEELMQIHFPLLHKSIRKRYNVIGNCIHKHYHIFSNKYFSDIIYFLMKPLEWFFLLVIYSICPKPESLIAKQYVLKKSNAL